MRRIKFLNSQPTGFEPIAELRTGQPGEWRLNPNTDEPEQLNGQSETQDVILTPTKPKPKVACPEHPTATTVMDSRYPEGGTHFCFYDEPGGRAGHWFTPKKPA